MSWERGMDEEMELTKEISRALSLQSSSPGV